MPTLTARGSYDDGDWPNKCTSTPLRTRLLEGQPRLPLAITAARAIAVRMKAEDKMTPVALGLIATHGATSIFHPLTWATCMPSYPGFAEANAPEPGLAA